MDDMEKEMCNNCKKEIPQPNYVMHTMHCARNITLCKVCNEPIPRSEYENHRKNCKTLEAKKVNPSPTPTSIERSFYFQKRKTVEDKKMALRRENYLKKHEHLANNGYSLKDCVKNDHSSSSDHSEFDHNISGSRDGSVTSSSKGTAFNRVNKENEASRNYSASMPSINIKKDTSNERNEHQNGAIKKPPLIPRLDDGSGAKPKTSQGLLACRYCDLELPKLELEEHENYCGSRTDKCLECGELVMFKNKQVHLDSNHGLMKLKDESDTAPSWDSSTQRSSNINMDVSPTRRRFDRIGLSAIDYDPMPYLPAAYQPGGGIRKNKEGESYKEISRRLDCKTEYIRNLLHDSANITIPLRSTGTAPRNHFNHNKGPAPQPPRRRRNPPTELTIPCEFCGSSIPHEELIEHETGCRPDLARYIPGRRRTSVPLPDENDTPYEAPVRHISRADSPDTEELPCEFCANMVPASQLWRHQLSCTSAA